MGARSLFQSIKHAALRRSVVIGGAATVLVLTTVVLGVMAFGPTHEASSSKVALPGLGDRRGAGATTSETSSSTGSSSTSTNATGSSSSSTSGSTSGSTSRSNSGSGAHGGSSTNGTKNKSVGDPFAAQIADIAGLLPTSFSGYSVGAVAKSGSDVVVAATPSGSASAQRILWAVHDRGSTSAAKTFITKVSKATFPVDAGNVSVHGVQGYYGTDGIRFATLAFARGRYVFEVLGTASGSDPGLLHGTVVDAALAFPASPPK